MIPEELEKYSAEELREFSEQKEEEDKKEELKPIGKLKNDIYLYPTGSDEDYPYLFQYSYILNRNFVTTEEVYNLIKRFKNSFTKYGSKGEEIYFRDDCYFNESGSIEEYGEGIKKELE